MRRSRKRVSGAIVVGGRRKKRRRERRGRTDGVREGKGKQA